MEYQESSAPKNQEEPENDTISIAIEVENDLFRKTESAQPENIAVDEVEEGEIEGPEDNVQKMEDDDIAESFVPMDFPEYKKHRYFNPFLKCDKEKLVSRAERFGLTPGQSPMLKPSTPSQSNRIEVDEDALLELYHELALFPETCGQPSMDKLPSNVRTECVLIRGTNDMSTRDIFRYMLENNQYPKEIEWVNDACCVLIFNDKYEAASCILNGSKPIAPPKERSPKTSELSSSCVDEYDKVDEVPFDWVKIPVPRGQVWRFARPANDAKAIVMRLATNDDKKQNQAERHSVYYRKHGNPNHVSAGFRGSKNKTISSSSSVKTFKSSEDAWAALSEEWNREEARSHSGRNKDYAPKPSKSFSTRELRERPSYNQRKADFINQKSLSVTVDFDSKGTIKDRLSLKRSYSSTRSTGDPDSTFHDQHEFRENLSDDEVSEASWSKRLRGPRMKMYADEEPDKRKSVFSKLYA